MCLSESNWHGVIFNCGINDTSFKANFLAIWHTVLSLDSLIERPNLNQIALIKFISFRVTNYQYFTPMFNKFFRINL